MLGWKFKRFVKKLQMWKAGSINYIDLQWLIWSVHEFDNFNKIPSDLIGLYFDAIWSAMMGMRSINHSRYSFLKQIILSAYEVRHNYDLNVQRDLEDKVHLIAIADRR